MRPTKKLVLTQPLVLIWMDAKILVRPSPSQYASSFSCQPFGNQWAAKTIADYLASQRLARPALAQTKQPRNASRGLLMLFSIRRIVIHVV